MRILKLVALTALALNTSWAWADNNTSMENVVNFQTILDKEIETDRWLVTLFTQAQNEKLDVANKEVNQKLQKTANFIKKHNTIKVMDSNISSTINYNVKTGKQTGWTVRGQVIISVPDSKLLAKVLDDLQSTMAVQNISAKLSKEKLAEEQQKMRAELIAKFKQQAEFYADQFEAKGYKIISLNFENFSTYIGTKPFVLYASNRSAESKVPVMLLDSKKENLSMGVTAEIQLVRSNNLTFNQTNYQPSTNYRQPVQSNDNGNEDPVTRPLPKAKETPVEPPSPPLKSVVVAPTTPVKPAPVAKVNPTKVTTPSKTATTQTHVSGK